MNDKQLRSLVGKIDLYYKRWAMLCRILDNDMAPKSRAIQKRLGRLVLSQPRPILNCVQDILDNEGDLYPQVTCDRCGITVQTSEARSSEWWIYEDGERGRCLSCCEDSIEFCDISLRTYGCLCKCRLYSLKQIAAMSDAELLNIRNFGKKSLDELKGILRGKGLLKED